MRAPSRAAALALAIVPLAAAGCGGPDAGPVPAFHLIPVLRSADGEGSVSAGRVAHAGLSLETVELAGGTEVLATVRVPAGARLLFHLVGRGAVERTRASLSVGRGSRREEVWSAPRLPIRSWSRHAVDLSRWAGQEVELRFSVEGDPGTIAFWGSPVLVGAEAARPDVLLYTIDTLRADWLGTWGFPGRTTPTLDALARGGTLFPDCWSSSSWTRAAMASVMTSRSAPSHGVIDDRARVGDDLPLLAEQLRDAGWMTVALITNPNAGKVGGLDRGFDVMIEPGELARHFVEVREPEGTLSVGATQASGTSERVWLWLREQLSWLDGAPVFLYLHVNDPHEPYDPAPPFATLPGVGHPEVGKRWRATAQSYGGDVRSADFYLRRTLSVLRQSGRLDGAVLAVIADHGEEFGEHGSWGHGRNLLPTQARVPWILAGAGVPRGRLVTERASLVDVAPTLLELVGLPPVPSHEGRSMVPALPEGGDLPDAPIHLHLVRQLLRIDPEYDSDAVPAQIARIDGRWALLTRDYGKGPRTRLYDLEEDPGQQIDVSDRHPEVARRMEEEAREWWRERRRDTVTGEIDPEDARILEALGYTGD
jgi:arylsulfatase A-like enzyme